MVVVEVDVESSSRHYSVSKYYYVCVWIPGAKAEELGGRHLSLEMPIASQYHTVMWCSGFSTIFYSILYRELLHFFFLT